MGTYLKKAKSATFFSTSSVHLLNAAKTAVKGVPAAEDVRQSRHTKRKARHVGFYAQSGRYRVVGRRLVPHYLGTSTCPSWSRRRELGHVESQE